MQCSNLTDDELWRAITKNTNTMSALFELRAKGPAFQTNAMLSISRALDNLEREYQDYVTELRRRHSPDLSSEKPSNVGSDQAA